MKAQSEWPPKFRKARVRAEPTEWQRILMGLYDRGIVEFVDEADLPRDQGGRPLLNGAFGVPKGEPGAPGFDADPAPCASS